MGQVSDKQIYHYVYRMTNLLNGHWYGGLRSSFISPEKDPYMGSGIRIRHELKKYGSENFIKEIIGVFTSRVNAALFEGVFIDIKALMDPFCINLKTGGEYQHGGKYKEEVGAKISESIKRAYAENPDYCLKLSAGLKKAYAENPDYGKQISAMRKRVSKDPVHQEKYSEARKKLMANPEYIAKITAAQNRPEVKEKRSASLKAYCNTDLGQINLSNATKDSIYINKNGKSKRIKADKLEQYINTGWTAGSNLTPSEETKIKLSNGSKGRTWIHHIELQKNLKIKSEKLDFYLTDGWHLGCKKWKNIVEQNLESCA